MNLTGTFNDRVDEIFAEGKYLSPRYSGVSLELPSQRAGARAGRVKLMAKIDDTACVRLPRPMGAG